MLFCTSFNRDASPLEVSQLLFVDVSLAGGTIVSPLFKGFSVLKVDFDLTRFIFVYFASLLKFVPFTTR